MKTIAKILLLWGATLFLVAAESLPTREEIDAVRVQVKERMAEEVAAMERGEKTGIEVADSCCAFARADERAAYRLLLFRAAFRLYLKEQSYDRAVGVLRAMKGIFGNEFLIPAQDWLRPHEARLKQEEPSDAIKTLLACLHAKIPQPEKTPPSQDTPTAETEVAATPTNDVPTTVQPSWKTAAKEKEIDQKTETLRNMRRYEKIAQKYGFKIERKPTFKKGGIQGKKIPDEQLDDELDRFFDALKILPLEFVKRSGINIIIICSDLTLANGKHPGGIAVGSAMYLPVGFSPKTVYHELFHIFDNKKSDSKWTDCNPKSFVYKGSSLQSITLNKKEKKAVERNRDDDRIQKAFVTDYAQSFEREDRAETFAHMMSEGPAFLRRTEQSPELTGKMKYIIKLTGKKGLLGKDFWDKRFAGTQETESEKEETKP
ncbi:MAG: hypothetical protein IJR99_00930 [Kiritimatiellae bacterium]|nr:hypothetical protein [Kiritimatiellia bacterium]